MGNGRGGQYHKRVLITCLTVTQPDRLKELDRGIRCFARQTYPERELVVVHDGDRGLHRRLRRMIDGPLGGEARVVRAEAGASLGELRNLSVRHAHGELVCQWDDDDLYHPARLERQHRRLVETGSDFCFLTDQLHWFQNTGEFFWDDWNVEPYPMNLIQGTLMGRRAMMPAYPSLSLGEDTPVLQALHRRGVKLAALDGHGYLYIYTYSGKNAWDLAHHAAISQWKRLRGDRLEAARELLTAHLKEHELPLRTARFPHDTGELRIELGESGPVGMLGAMNSDIVLATTHHGKYFVLRNDFLGGLFIDGQHFEDHIISVILGLLKGMRNLDVVDVGANFGGYTVPFANLVRATVHAFEPQSIIYDLLLKNIEQNGCRNVIPYKIALGHQNDLTTTLGDKYELFNQVHSLNEPRAGHNYGGIGLGTGYEAVTMQTLDSYRLDKVGLIKIDVEGAERLVLLGAAETIRRNKPYIVFEQHGAPREHLFDTRWQEMCDMLSVPPAIRHTSIFELLSTDFGYPETVRIDENNYLAIP